MEVPPGSKIFTRDKSEVGVIGRFKKSAFTGNVVRKKKLHKTFPYPVKTVKSATYVPARANNSVDSERTEASRTFCDRRCPRMSLVHLAITTLLTLAGLSTLQPHVPPAICPYSQEAISLSTTCCITRALLDGNETL